MKAIDGSVSNAGLTVYDVPEMDSELSIDFIDRGDLLEIEDGIKKIQQSNDLLALVQGIAIVKIEREALWRQAGFPSLQAYRIEQNKRLGMPRQTVSRRRAVGEGFLDNRRLLGKFSLSGHVEKLRLLNEAVRVHGKKEAIAKFKSSTLQEFVLWVRPRIVAELPTVDCRVGTDGILINGLRKISFDPELPGVERDWIGALMERAYRARAGGNHAHVVSVYDPGEARAVDNFLKKLRAQK